MYLMSSETPGAWIRSRLHPFGIEVGSVIPEGFQAYARIMHSTAPYREVETWGSMPGHIAIRPIELLGPHTRTPEECWFGIWEGWAGLGAPFASAMPTLVLPGRNYHIMGGRLDEAAESLSDPADLHSHRSPNLWWPEDRSWFVATEIDLAWSFVGGTTACVDSVLGQPDLAARLTTPHDPIVTPDVSAPWGSVTETPPSGRDSPASTPGFPPPAV